MAPAAHPALGDEEPPFAPEPGDVDDPAPAVGGDAPVSLSWPNRALGATAAAIGAAWAAVHLLGPLPVAPPALAVLTWLLVLTLPRIGWLASGTILVAAAAARHHPGGALVLLIALLLPVVLIPWRATSWPLAIAAPVLGAVGLAGAWPALAGRASGFGWRRAALGAIGYVWVIVASLVVGTDLYMRRPPGTAAPAVWTGSLDVTVHDVLYPLVKSGVLAGAPVWGIAAAALPWLLRGRTLTACVVITTVWSAVLVSATETAVAIVHHGHGLGDSARSRAGCCGRRFDRPRPGAVRTRAPNPVFRQSSSGTSVAWDRRRTPFMSVLRSIESKIASLVEGTFSRAFRSEVRPVEIARRLAREMEEHKSFSVNRTYVPNEYRVYLSPRDRDRFASYEEALAAELGGYLLEHARRERFAMLSKPVIQFETDDRLGLGEFGIQTRVVQPEHESAAPPSAGGIVRPDDDLQHRRPGGGAAGGAGARPPAECPAHHRRQAHGRGPGGRHDRAQPPG